MESDLLLIKRSHNVMSPNALLRTAAVLIFLTAIGGLVMAGLRAKMDRPPAWLAMAHGLLAAAGLTLLLYAAFTIGLPKMMTIGVLFLLTAGGVGLYLNLSFQAKLLPLPIRPIFIHAVLAVVGVFLIALGSFGNPPSGP
jgi:hypothetical protein